jgi:hypothetical protein
VETLVLYYVVKLLDGRYYWRDVRSFTPRDYRFCVTRDCAYKFPSADAARAEMAEEGHPGYAIETVTEVN